MLAMEMEAAQKSRLRIGESGANGCVELGSGRDDRSSMVMKGSLEIKVSNG
jgi:hypothetical protein